MEAGRETQSTRAQKNSLCVSRHTAKGKKLDIGCKHKPCSLWPTGTPPMAKGCHTRFLARCPDILEPLRVEGTAGQKQGASCCAPTPRPQPPAGQPCWSTWSAGPLVNHTGELLQLQQKLQLLVEATKRAISRQLAPKQQHLATSWPVNAHSCHPCSCAEASQKAASRCAQRRCTHGRALLNGLQKQLPTRKPCD